MSWETDILPPPQSVYEIIFILLRKQGAMNLFAMGAKLNYGLKGWCTPRFDALYKPWGYQKYFFLKENWKGSQPLINI